MEALSPDASWKDWFQQHGPKLLLCARQWTRSLADAEDVVQDAFVRFWRNQRHLGGNPQSLLVTSIRRAAIDLARHDARRTAREEASVEPDERFFEFEPDGDERVRAIEAALRRL
ncbi:MAG: RNA polymerase sigma factor, partial [Cephaloticoccus sp.]